MWKKGTVKEMNAKEDCLVEDPLADVSNTRGRKSCGPLRLRLPCDWWLSTADCEQWPALPKLCGTAVRGIIRLNPVACIQYCLLSVVAVASCRQMFGVSLRPFCFEPEPSEMLLTSDVGCWALPATMYSKPVLQALTNNTAVFVILLKFVTDARQTHLILICIIVDVDLRYWFLIIVFTLMINIKYYLNIPNRVQWLL